MSMPTPFEMGRAVSQNIGGAFQQQRDRSAIDEILEQANASEDEGAIDSAMQQILSRVSPDRQQVALQLLQNKQKNILAQKEAAQKQQQDSQQQQDDLRGPLQALDTLESLVDQEGIGAAGFAQKYSPKARHNAGVFNSTQAALLPLFKSMFPRGMTEKEFKYINDNYIPQSTDSRATIKGKIQGLRQLSNKGGQQNAVNPQTGRPNIGQQGASENNQQIVSIQGADGATYDIPANLVQQFKAEQGIQ